MVRDISSSNELLRDDITETREQDSKDPDIIPAQDDWNCLPRREPDQSLCEMPVTTERCMTSHIRQHSYTSVPEQSTSSTSLMLQKSCGCRLKHENCCKAEFLPMRRESTVEKGPASYNALTTSGRPSGEQRGNKVTHESSFHSNSSGLISTSRMKQNKERKFISTAV
ncbi:uncharacterized protein LOC111085066 [Limulus polyphemus]|uniref:Uncharacterized protein LOC111085066 n=1 Tax=Limulus polyphemus TaxID=6850 RepID=A0ABM1S2K1_LIMPO|nr:uncharacterized protein LOC111085066 [Limulus polyphemus]